MSLEARLKAAWGDALAREKALAAFDAWWCREFARMRNAKLAAPRGTDSQGPPYLPRQFRAPLARSLAARAMQAKTAAQLRYLARKAERKTRLATIASMSTGSLGIEDSRRIPQGALTNFHEAPPMRGPTLTSGPDLPPSAPERAP